MIKKKSINEDEYYTKTKVKCICGHVTNFVGRKDYKECSHCNRIIFKNKKAEYNYKIKRRLGL